MNQHNNIILFNKSILLNHITLNKSLANCLKLEIFEAIDSTSDYLKTVDLQGNFYACVAEQQTKGRGRFARTWYSPFGQNIYLSIGINFAKDLTELMGVSLVVGLAVLSAIKAYGITEKFFIKWPNDILWQEQKIAGILIEANTEINSNCALIIGVGLNLNMSDDLNYQDLKPYTSLRVITGQMIDKNKIAALLISDIIKFIKKFEEVGFASFSKQWQDHDYLNNKNIAIAIGNKVTAGLYKGIDQHGQLILQLKNGQLKKFSAGEASICSLTTRQKAKQ